VGLKLSTLVRLALAVFVLILLSVYAPHFFSSRNLTNLLVQTAPLCLLAIGMCIVLLGGGIDVAISANTAMAAIFGAMFIVDSGSVLGGVAIMVLSGAAIGAVSGISVGYLGMIPFVVTLAIMTLNQGLAVWMTSSRSIAGFPEVYLDTMMSRPMGIPLQAFIWLGVGILMTLLVTKTIFGRQLVAVGTSERAAKVARVNTSRIKLISYILAGAMSGLAAVLLTGRLGSASATLGADSIVLDAITACVIGGVSIYGGKGTVPGAIIGAIFVTVLNNAMNQLGVSFFTSLIIKGFLIVAIIAIDQIDNRKIRAV